LVSATQWGIPLKGWSAKAVGQGYFHEKGREAEGGFKRNPREQGGTLPYGRAGNLIGRYLNAPVTRDICAT